MKESVRSGVGRVMLVRAMALAVMLTVTPFGWSQDAKPAADAAAPPVAPAQATVPAAAAPVTPAPKKKGKEEYTGPNTIVELAPMPMVDEEGRPRLDPDGKPMFNPPVKQQRDKKGHPLFDEKGKPVFQTAAELGYDEHGKKLHGKKEKPPKLVSLTISRGTMTVDGMTGKAALNYDIADLKYIYLYAPGIGVTIVSNQMFPGATEEPNAFNDKALTVTVGEHTLEIYSDKTMLGKKPEPAFVRVDRDFKLPTKFPVVGYGTLRVPPYMWPGAKENEVLAGTVKAPPLPESLRPVALLSACPAGQMRQAARKPLPGETLPAPPCVPIDKAKPAAPATESK